jgi:hypothetical protein
VALSSTASGGFPTRALRPSPYDLRKRLRLTRAPCSLHPARYETWKDLSSPLPGGCAQRARTFSELGRERIAVDDRAVGAISAVRPSRSASRPASRTALATRCSGAVRTKRGGSGRRGRRRPVLLRAPGAPWAGLVRARRGRRAARRPARSPRPRPRRRAAQWSRGRPGTRREHRVSGGCVRRCPGDGS